MDDEQASEAKRAVPGDRPVSKPDSGPLFTEPGQFGGAVGQQDEPGAIVPFQSDPIDDRLALTDELTQSVLDAVVETEAVEERLSDHRYEAVGLARGDRKQTGEKDRPLVLVVADYSANTTVEITVKADAYDVTDVSVTNQQPALSPAEVDRALELLNEHGPVEDALPRHTVREAFLVSTGVPTHHRHRNRGVVLTFDATGTDRFTHTSAATHVAEIDLSADALIDVREVPDVPSKELASTPETAAAENVDE